jgi:hypothetical protein
MKTEKAVEWYFIRHVPLFNPFRVSETLLL